MLYLQYFLKKKRVNRPVIKVADSPINLKLVWIITQWYEKLVKQIYRWLITSIKVLYMRSQAYQYL